MIYTNSLMSVFLKEHRVNIIDENLSQDLKDILNEGFLIIDDCHFLKAIYPNNYSKVSIDKSNIEKDFIDISGFEASTNNFHIEDYTEKDPFVQAIIFSRKFKEKWRESFPLVGYTNLISFQDDEIGKFATFTFHKNRENELVYEPSNIEVNDAPLCLEVVL